MSIDRFAGVLRAHVTWVLAGALALSCGQAFAASEADRINALERKLDESLKLIRQLSERVRQLEGSQAPATSATSRAPSQAQTDLMAERIGELEQEVTAMANRPEPDRGLEVHGFADVGFAAAPPGQPSGARIGALDFYLTPNFSDRIRSLFELNFECCDEGHVGVDLERMQIGYTVSDALTAWAGRFHTPIGYWNTAFHHGAQLQTTIRRPKFLDFEDAGGILPVHTVGAWGTGAVRTEGGRFGYDVYVGNAPTIQVGDPLAAGTGTLDPGLGGADSRSASVGANIQYAFRGTFYGLRAGLHMYTAKVTDTAALPNSTRLRVFGPWLVYLTDDWEVLLEQYAFRNDDASGGGGHHSSNAGYAQVGRMLGAWTPYARYERASLDQNDAYFAQQESGQSYTRWVAGFRYDINPKTAVKLEASRTNLTDRVTSDYSELLGQLAVRF